MVDCTDAAQGYCRAEQPRGMLEKTERIILRSYISIDSRVSACSKAIHGLCKTVPTIPEHLRALLSTRSIHSCVLSKDVPPTNERNSVGLLYNYRSPSSACARHLAGVTCSCAVCQGRGPSSSARDICLSSH